MPQFQDGQRYARGRWHLLVRGLFAIPSFVSGQTSPATNRSHGQGSKFLELSYLESFRSRDIPSESLRMPFPLSRAINSLKTCRTSFSPPPAAFLTSTIGLSALCGGRTLSPLSSPSHISSVATCSGSAVVNDKPIPIPFDE